MGDEAKFKRPQVWMDSIGMIKDFPVWGTGLGTFSHAYPRYQSRYPTALFEHAENDYLEILTDTGITGFTVLAAAAVLFFQKVIARWMDRHGSFVKCAGAGGISSCVAMAIHSVTDFNMRIPANALLLAVVAGITYATVTLPRDAG